MKVFELIGRYDTTKSGTLDRFEFETMVHHPFSSECSEKEFSSDCTMKELQQEKFEEFFLDCTKKSDIP